MLSRLWYLPSILLLFQQAIHLCTVVFVLPEFPLMCSSLCTINTLHRPSNLETVSFYELSTRAYTRESSNMKAIFHLSLPLCSETLDIYRPKGRKAEA